MGSPNRTGSFARTLLVLAALGAAFLAPGLLAQSSAQSLLQADQAAEKARRAGDRAREIEELEEVLRRGRDEWSEEDARKFEPLVRDRMGVAYQALRKFDEADEAFRKSQAIRQEAGNESGVAKSLNFRAVLAQERGDKATAQQFYEKALGIWQSRGAREALTVRYNLADLRLTGGEYAEAEDLYLLNLKQAERQRDAMALAMNATGLAHVYQLMGRYDEARRFFAKSQRSFADPDEDEVKPEDRAFLALRKSYQADLYTEMLRHDLRLGESEAELFRKAERLNREAIAGWERVSRAAYLKVAVCKNNLAWLYMSRGDYDKAKPLLEEGLSVWENRFKKQGKGAREWARCLSNLGDWYQANGDYARAADFFTRGLDVRKQHVADITQDLALSLYNLARLNGSRGRLADAVDEMAEAQRILRRYMSNVLPTLYMFEQMAFRETQHDPAFSQAVSLGFELRSPDAAEKSAEWALNAKGMSQQALGELIQKGRGEEGDQAASVLGRLARVRGQLAALTYLAPTTDERRESYQKKLTELSEAEQHLSKQLSDREGKSRAADPWVGLAEVRRAVPADAVLVELAVFRPWDFRAKGLHRAWAPERHYAACVIPPAG